MRLCKNCFMVQIDVPSRTHTVRLLNFSDGFHWCERCIQPGARREPARYFIMMLERVEATTEKEVSVELEECIAEQLMRLGWTPPENSRWSKTPKN